MRTLNYDYPEPCDRCHTQLATTTRRDDALCPSCAHITDMARLMRRLDDEAQAEIEEAQFDVWYS